MEQFTHAEARAVALAEMTKWGLIDRGWKFLIDNAKTRHGQCSYTEKRISLTRNRIDHDSKEQVVYTIRHEIAHALHLYVYVDAGRREDFYARRWTGRKWVRKVAPHGVEWKGIARKVGVKKPASSSAGNARKNVIQKWRVVLVKNGTVTDTDSGYHRFPKRMSARYYRGRKSETLGNLFLVRGSQWKSYLDGRLSVARMSFYQDLQTAPVSNGIAGLII